MSKEKGEEPTSQSSEQQKRIRESRTSSSSHFEHRHQQHHTSTSQSAPTPLVPPSLETELVNAPRHDVEEEERKPGAKRDQPSEATSQTTDETASRPRQVIAVSASKGPAAFFNLARKFLVTDEMCDLSALEGAIVSAVDAAHLLERSKLATIVKIQTSYVTVEPKRRKQAPTAQSSAASSQGAVSPSPVEGVQRFQGPSGSPGSPTADSQTRKTTSGRELRRARIVITVRRTENYKKWLEDNPLQAIIAGDAEEEEEAAAVDVPDEAGH